MASGESSELCRDGGAELFGSGKIADEIAIALAGAGFKAGAVQDADLAARIDDESVELQLSRSNGDSGAVAAEHGGDVLVGKVDHRGFHSVRAEQEPARKTFIDGVAGVAAGGLRGLKEVGLVGAEGEIVELAVPGELLPGVRDRGRISATSDLHVDAVQTARSSHHGRIAQDGLEAHHADFDLGAIFKGSSHGGDSVFEEDDLMHLGTGSLYIATQR